MVWQRWRCVGDKPIGSVGLALEGPERKCKQAQPTQGVGPRLIDANPPPSP